MAQRSRRFASYAAIDEVFDRRARFIVSLRCGVLPAGRRAGGIGRVEHHKLRELVVFKEESRGCTAVPQRWDPKIQEKFGIKEAPDWWSKELGAWANDQRTFGKAFKKPASERSRPRRNTPRTLQSAASRC